MNLSPFHIGASGWSYAHWQGVFYPDGTPNRAWLEYYTRFFDTVELNSSFYHWPRDATFENWARRLPDGFRLTVKAPRGLTHAARLRSPAAWLARLRRGLSLLGSQRGALLVQLPPDMERDDARLEAFLDGAARDLSEVPLALEFRHPSWHAEPVFALLERYSAAYCVMSGAGLPCILRATAPFVYLRLHGPNPQALYSGSYSEADLRWWADRLREWQDQGREVWAYFNNDMRAYAVQNALALKALLGD